MASAQRSRRRKNRFVRRTQPGAPPGFLVPSLDAADLKIHAICFSMDACHDQRIQNLSDLRDLIEAWPVTWVNVDGLGDTTAIREIGELFQLHRLALEDVVHTHQRAKAESYADHYFIVARMPKCGLDAQTEQLSMFVGRKFVITFQEAPDGDCLDVVRERIRGGLVGCRTTAPGYLAYAILDAIVDHYFPLVEEIGERIDHVEEQVFERPKPALMESIHRVKRDLQHLRRAVWPLRDAFTVLLRDESPLFSSETRVYLRDCHDHTIQIIDLLENYRDVTSGLTDVYLSNLSQRTNEIVKVLTIISTIFIPLNFIAGIYGMNFDPDASELNMPELRWRYGYLMVLSIMWLLGLVMVFAFWRRGWFGSGDRPRRLALPLDESA